MSSTPAGVSDATDPCKSVYPLNIWRMPTKADFEAIGNPNEKDRESNLIMSFKWNQLAGTPNNPHPVYPDDQLRLKFYGSRNEAGTILWAPGYPTPSGEVRFWTSTQATNANNAWYFFGTSTTSGTSQVLNHYMRDADVVTTSNKKQGYNIRCVRNVGSFGLKNYKIAWKGELSSPCNFL